MNYSERKNNSENTFSGNNTHFNFSCRFLMYIDDLCESITIGAKFMPTKSNNHASTCDGVLYER